MSEGGFDLTEIRAQMSPIGQEALDAAVARLLLAQTQQQNEELRRRVEELERQKPSAAERPGRG